MAEGKGRSAEKALDAMFSDVDSVDEEQPTEQEEEAEKPDSPRTKLRKKRQALADKRTNAPRRTAEAIARATGDPSKKPIRAKEAKKEMRAKQRENVENAWTQLGLGADEFAAEKTTLLKAMASNNTARAQEIIAAVTAAKRDREAAKALFVPPGSQVPLG